MTALIGESGPEFTISVTGGFNPEVASQHVAAAIRRAQLERLNVSHAEMKRVLRSARMRLRARERRQWHKRQYP